MSTIPELLNTLRHAALTAAISNIVTDPDRAHRQLNIFNSSQHFSGIDLPCPSAPAPTAAPAETPAPAAPAAEAEQVPAKTKTPAQKRGKAVEAEKPAETPAAEPDADLPQENPAYPNLDLKAMSALEVPEIRQAGKEWWMGTIDQLTTADSAKGDQLRLEMRAEIGKHKEGSVSIKDIPDDKVLEFWGIIKKLAAKYTA